MKHDCPIQITLARKPLVTKEGNFEVIEKGDTQLISIEWNRKLINKDQKRVITMIDKHIRSLLNQQLGQGGK